MFNDFKVAQKTHEKMMEIFESLNDSTSLLESENITDHELSEYHKFIGSLMGAITTDFLNVMYRQHPALKPEGYMLPEDFLCEKN
jgi:hypothetical protein